MTRLKRPFTKLMFSGNVSKSKYTSTTQKSALVAMAFNEKTLKLREAIRKGIQDAGYLAVFIDEVEHNDFITPELLKHIEDSKFVVVDLLHQNNGAYFEEGYAMGIGKPVIQLCKQDVKLHFDIAQKNTIIWSNESEISDRLKRRILATIVFHMSVSRIVKVHIDCKPIPLILFYDTIKKTFHQADVFW